MAIHPVALLVLVLSPLLVSCVDDIAYFPENGHYYQWVPLDHPITWDEAKTMASSKSHNSMTGYPVTIGTSTEQDFLSKYLSQITLAPLNSSTDYLSLWGGAFRNGNSWIWSAAGRVSNPFFDVGSLKCATYCNWNISTAAAFANNYTCLQIYLNNANGPTPGTWRPAMCTAVSQALVVEYDASKTCDPGYTYSTSKGWCEDINECANNPKICGNGYQCNNTIGAYNCSDIDECALNSTRCGPGYWCNNTAGGFTCNDINECAQTPSVCDSGYTCQNSVGSFQCIDINECQANSSLCNKKGYVCQNTPGSYLCNDIDECKLQPPPCSFGTKCSNTIGSYTCDSIYYQIQSNYNGLVLDFTIIQGICRIITAVITNATSQLWSFTPEGYIVNGNNGYVVDAEGGLVYPGVKAILWQRKPLPQAVNQLWSYDQTTQYWSSANYNNTVLDIYGAQTAPGAQICLFTPKASTDTPEGDANQRWTLLETTQRP